MSDDNPRMVKRAAAMPNGAPVADLLRWCTKESLDVAHVGVEADFTSRGLLLCWWTPETPLEAAERETWQQQADAKRERAERAELARLKTKYEGAGP